VYQRKDWIDSDGKTVKPHDHETNPEERKKIRNRLNDKKKDVRTSEGPMVKGRGQTGWVDSVG
jgi:hypothetical protein